MNLAQKLKERCLLSGDFTLRSGEKSNSYFDKYRLESDPELLNAIAIEMAKLIPPKTELLLGLELGGVPLVTALSLVSKIECRFVRKKAKHYGTLEFVEGGPYENKKIILVEDVITSGGQLAQSTKDLSYKDVEIIGAISVLYRGGKKSPSEETLLKDLNFPINALFTLDSIK